MVGLKMAKTTGHCRCLLTVMAATGALLAVARPASAQAPEVVEGALFLSREGTVSWPFSTRTTIFPAAIPSGDTGPSSG